ncbi:MAG: hypothetical protein ACOY4I_18205 [Bacillota bacterium]
MLFLSLLFILAGMCLVTAAGVAVTYVLINTEERIKFQKPQSWPPAVKKWARYGGTGLGATLLGMILAIIAT